MLMQFACALVLAMIFAILQSRHCRLSLHI